MGIFSWFRRRPDAVSVAWLADHARRSSCGGWTRDVVHRWLPSEADERRRAERREKTQAWRDTARAIDPGQTGRKEQKRA